jgi:hypothetical protein
VLTIFTGENGDLPKDIGTNIFPDPAEGGPASGKCLL